MSEKRKAVWVLLLIWFGIVEFLSIESDRHQHDLQIKSIKLTTVTR